MIMLVGPPSSVVSFRRAAYDDGGGDDAPGVGWGGRNIGR